MRHYLDHAATSPMRPVAREAYVQALATFGNPSSVHATGRAANGALETAREEIAALLGAHPTEVVFTSGATEAANSTVHGLWAERPEGRVLHSAIEHHAVLEPLAALADRGAQIGALPVSRAGVLDLDEAARQIDPGRGPVCLVAVQSANNETGAIQPVAELAPLVERVQAPLVVDAAQSIGHVPWTFRDSGATVAFASAHKWGGPGGVGVMLARRVDGDVPARRAQMAPLLRGGGQERGLRAGTVNVAGAVAAVAALREAEDSIGAEVPRLRSLASHLADAIAGMPGVTVTGPPVGTGRLPGIVSAVVEGAPSEAMLFLLDAAGVDASNGAACNAGVVQPSHVIEAMGLGAEAAGSSLRISMGWTTTQEDVDTLIHAMPEAIERARASRR